MKQWEFCVHVCSCFLNSSFPLKFGLGKKKYKHLEITKAVTTFSLDLLGSFFEKTYVSTGRDWNYRNTLSFFRSAREAFNWKSRKDVITNEKLMFLSRWNRTFQITWPGKYQNWKKKNHSVLLLSLLCKLLLGVNFLSMSHWHSFCTVSILISTSGQTCAQAPGVIYSSGNKETHAVCKLHSFSYPKCNSSWCNSRFSQYSSETNNIFNKMSSQV